MCGIVGVFKKNTDIKLGARMFAEALFADQLRGFHGTGVMTINKQKELTVYKRALAANDFLQLRQTDKIIYADDIWAYIGHNRYATQGSHVDQHTHPFTYDHITMIHNGTLRWSYLLNNIDFKVDSEAIAYMLSKTTDLGKDLARIEGAYALVWYDAIEDAVFMTRNNERPLHYITSVNGNYTCVSSEAELMAWIMTRNSQDWKDIYEVEPGQVLRFDRDKMLPTEVLRFKPYAPPPTSKSWMDLWDEAEQKLNNNLPAKQNKIEVVGNPDNPRRTAHQVAVAQFLEDNKLWIGKEITFICESVEEQEYPKEYKSVPQGLLRGIPTKTLTCDAVVRAHKVDLSVFEEGVVGVGKIGGIQINMEDNQAPVNIWLRPGVEEWEIPYSLDELEQYNTALVEDDDEDDILDTDAAGLPASTILAPLEPMVHKKQPGDLDEARFYQLVKHGCAYCSDRVEFEDMDKLLWTTDGQPICPSCVKANDLSVVRTLTN